MLKISIVIPTYNMAGFLRQALLSIQMQGYPNVEVIVVDGGSKDATAEVVAEFEGLVSTFISEPDRGQADAVTKGLKLATGDIHHWHAADDVVLPDALHTVSRCFSSDPQLGLVFSDGVAFNDNIIVRTAPCRWVRYSDALLFFGRFQSDCAYWRGSMTQGALPLDVSKPLIVDEDFFLRLWKGAKHLWLPVALGAFRMHGDQVSQRVDRTNLSADRADSRARIFSENGWDSRRVLLLRVRVFPGYLARRFILAGAEKLLVRLARFATNDRYRRSLHHWLNTFWQGGGVSNEYGFS